MTAGQPYSLIWRSTNATSVRRACTASGTGYAVSDAPAINGSASGTASVAWVNYPSTCTWTASGAAGSATFRETMVTQAAATTAEVVTYIHTDGLGSPVARTDAAGKLVSRTRYEPYGLTAGGATPTIGFTGHVNDADTGLVYMQQRYYDPVAGRFLSIDPVTTDANTGGSFNRYAYANNSPYKYIDPDGRNPALLLRLEYTLVKMAATAMGADKLGSKIGIGIYNAIHSDSNSNSSTPTSTQPTSGSAPPAPGTLVGEQGDKSGPTKNGNRHTSGPLTPGNGGTGDANKDFDKLTGGTGKPPDSSDSRSSIPGVQVGDNGVWIRPDGKDGPRIEIPAAPGKLPETLHYPPETR
jgi:RHS repeat-associated protein